MLSLYGTMARAFDSNQTLFFFLRKSKTPTRAALTYGMIEMGGASTQIANFENNGDLMVRKTLYRERMDRH